MRNVYLIAFVFYLIAGNSWSRPFDDVFKLNLGRELSSSIEDISLLIKNLNPVYKRGPLGEGKIGRVDRDPLVRFDQFDCTTFVETVLALSRSTSLPMFQRELKNIRYRGGQVSYLKRNHFPSLDWIPNNVEAGFVSDITTELTGNVKWAKGLIDKKSWAKKTGKTLTQAWPGPQWVSLPYIPIDSIFNKKANMIEQIPSGSIINIVKPNWNMVKKIGTRLNVSHQGFAIWRNGELFFRHMSPTAKRVVDIRLVDHLRKYRGNNKAVKGINVLASK